MWRRTLQVLRSHIRTLSGDPSTAPTRALQLAVPLAPADLLPQSPRPLLSPRRLHRQEEVPSPNGDNVAEMDTLAQQLVPLDRPAHTPTHTTPSACRPLH